MSVYTDIEELYAALREIIAEASGVPIERVILEDEGRSPPSPRGLYCAYEPLPVRAYGQPRTDQKDTDGPAEETTLDDWTDLEVTTVTQLELLLSLNFIEDGSKQAALRMHHANFREPVAAKLAAAGVAWMGASEIRDLTAVKQAGWQDRFQVDVRLIVQTGVTDTVLRAAGFSLEVRDENDHVLAEA